MIVIIKGRVVGARAVLEGHCVILDGGKIKQVAPTDQVLWPDEAKVIDAQGGYVAPGFIDLHVHGAEGRDTMEGTVDALAQIARFQARSGTTAWTPTVMTDSATRVSAALAAIEQARAHDFGGARILGAHLEGPYLSAGKCGAQPSNWLRLPEPAEYLPWLDRDGLVTQMTLAPELSGALELVDALQEREIIASAGHTAADFNQTQAAIDRGVYQATHLFNCMACASKQGPYRVPGALETLLADERVMVELIADGHHVHPALLRLALRAKGPDHILLVTDATAGSGLAEGASFQVGASPGMVRGGVGMTPDGQGLVGSVAPMIQLVRTMVQVVGVSVAEAVRMASLSPARALGINGCKGSLEPRKDADLVIFSEDFQVRKTFVGGHLEYQGP